MNLLVKCLDKIAFNPLFKSTRCKKVFWVYLQRNTMFYSSTYEIRIVYNVLDKASKWKLSWIFCKIHPCRINPHFH